MYQFPLFETIAIIDGVPQNLAFHQERLDFAFKYYFKMPNKILLADIIQPPLDFCRGLVRCRMEYNTHQQQIHYFPYIPRDIRRFQCVYTQDLDYRFKYNDRSRLNQLKTADCDEIIIINNGKVSDCSIGNLLFCKNDRWFTPADYLLKGTQLAALLAKQRIEPVPISASALFEYEKIMVINALNPFDEARAVAISPHSVQK